VKKRRDKGWVSDIRSCSKDVVGCKQKKGGHIEDHIVKKKRLACVTQIKAEKWRHANHKRTGRSLRVAVEHRENGQKEVKENNNTKEHSTYNSKQVRNPMKDGGWG